MKSVRNIVFSPHIDDAVLSLGGLIARLATSSGDLCVINIFTLSNWINPDGIFKDRFAETDTEVISNVRKAEEAESGRLLHYSTDFLDFPDLPLRDGLVSYHELYNRIKDKIKEYLGKDIRAFFPLGIDHPDHEIIAAIGYELLDEGYPVLFYEDMPYVARNYGSGNLVKAKAIQRGFISFPVEIDIMRKMEAIKVYESQVSEEWLIDIYNYSQKDDSPLFQEYIWSTFPNIYDQNFYIVMEG